MKRRDFIKNVALSSGLLLMPSMAFNLREKYQQPNVIIIGYRELHLLGNFCKQNSITSCTSIGWDDDHLNTFSIQNNKHIDFKFSSINTNHIKPLESSVLIPQNIKDIFLPNNKYLILCGLTKREAVFCVEIINWLDNETIDYWFFGLIPIVNFGIGTWLVQLFSKYENNYRVNSIYDITDCSNQLCYEYGNLPVIEAYDKYDDKFLGKLNEFYWGLVV